MALIDDMAGRRVDIPHEPGQWMELRELTWPELEKARKIKQSATFADLGEIGPDTLKQLQGLSSADVSQAIADPLASVDVLTVLAAGVLKWSYDAEVTVANLERLDAETARWAATQIVQAPNDEQRKNFFNGFTDASTVTASRPMSG
jgi:hypothetical protein